MGFKLDPREIGWAPYVMIGGGFGLACSCLRSRCSSSTPNGQLDQPSACIAAQAVTRG